MATPLYMVRFTSVKTGSIVKEGFRSALVAKELVIECQKPGSHYSAEYLGRDKGR